MMKCSSDKLVLYFSCFFFFSVIKFSHVHGLVEDINTCKSSSRCGKNGPSVRFPFRIKGKQPDNCGHPEHWFDLSCSQNNQTILHLTPSWNLTIKNINYTSQIISAYDSQGCTPGKILNFNSSLSPFRFHDIYDQYDTTLLDCSSKNESTEIGIVNCLRDVHHHPVHRMPSNDTVGYYEYFLSCVKMNDISYVPFDYLELQQKKLNLSWSEPDCRSCEANGEYCRLRRNTKNFKTECYGKPGSLTKFIAVSTTLGSILLVGAVVVLYRLYSYYKMKKDYQTKIEKFLEDYKSFKPTRFSYAHLKRMTNQFKDELGQGAYGTAYRGKLSDEILVAVKVLNHSKANGEEFINEVGTIGRIHHVNVVRLVGFCAEGFRRALVYEYLPNDSLQKFISSADAKDNFLGWKRLHDIVLGVAKGIDYLHQGCDQRILHFDIKPQNILLDHDFNPKVSDFGLAKLCGKDQSIVSMTTAKGTIGYMAPEVFSRNFGNVSFKSDVYSFGMLILEMVGGRNIVDEKKENDEQIYFPEWIYNLLEEGEDLRLEIGEEGDAKIAKKLAIVGLWCIQWNPTDRPCMKTVIQIMEGDGENLPIPPNPFASTTSATKKAKKAGKRIHLELEIISETE
ncbi:rust resistance kinase Lr10-like [Euphorbia lathyris]|uniref:rust resistance kinase Lr10-like n=1 Tax=Euphorbia lathyris TaxID=212925 RepID=UPI003314138E